MEQKNKEWKKEDTVKLINMYEEHSILWDKQCVNYRNREKKQKILQDFAAEFRCTTDEVQRKLHNLRNQVSQEMRKIKKRKSRVGTDEVYVTKWPYFSSLQFLRPSLTLNRTKSLMSLSARSSLDRTLHSRESIDISQEVHLTTDEDTNKTDSQRKKGNSQPIKKRKKRKYNKNNNSTDEKLFRCTLQSLQKPIDDDERFGQYVAMELRGIRSDICKRRLKNIIRKAIVEIIDEDDAMCAASSSSAVSTPMSSPKSLD